MEPTTIIGVIASVFTGASMLPQLIKVIREKSPQDISFIMMFVHLIGVSLWIWYGARKEDLIIIISNSVSVAINIAVCACSFYFHRQQHAT